MDGFIVTAAGLKLAYAVAAVLAAVYFSRWLDRRAGFHFRDAMESMLDDARATALYLGLRILAICLPIGLVVGCSPAQAGNLFPDRYDGQIRQAAERYWPEGPDWLWWRAQLYQESRLRPEAVSPVGAAGLAQFMPATWHEVARELRLPPGASPHADIAIAAGAYYMARLRRSWTAPRPAAERHRLAQASYNAGLGNILRAQSRCGGARDWPQIAPCLAQVTGTRHSAETLGYVAAIERWRGRMIADGARP